MGDKSKVIFFQLQYGQKKHIHLVAFSKSAAHSAAPTVLVKEKTIEANGTISRMKAAIPSLDESPSQTRTMWTTKANPGRKVHRTIDIHSPSICSPIFLNPSLSLCRIPPLELKVSRMESGSHLLALQKYIQRGSDHGDEVER